MDTNNNRHTKQVLREEWSGLAVRKGRRKNHEQRSQSVSVATLAIREERLRCKTRNAKSERFFWNPRRWGGRDDVDGSLKGNERGIIQTWVRIAAKAEDGLCRRTGGRKGGGEEWRDVRAGEWCSEGLCNQRWRPIVWRLGATIRGYGTVSAFSHAAGAMRSMVNAADDYALASPSPDN